MQRGGPGRDSVEISDPRRSTRDLERSEVAAALAGRADVRKTSPESRKSGESAERMVGGEVAKLGG
jgi:hypothetical protein